MVGWDVQFDRIRNAAVSGEGPDVTQAGTTQVPFFAALGGFAEPQRPRRRHRRQGRVRAGHLADDPGRRARTAPAAMPWFTEARAIYYRKDVLEKAGVDPATAFKDVDAFQRRCRRSRTRCRTIGGKPISPFGAPGKKAFDLVHHVMPFVWDDGGAELSDDAKKSTINTPAGRSRASSSWPT